MGENRGFVPQGEYKWSDLIKYSGVVPDCALSEDCHVDSNSLTYILGILLDRYCEEVSVPDTDFTSISLTCLTTKNPDVDSPDVPVTLTGLLEFYRDHFCSIYDKIAAQQLQIETLQNQIDILNNP